MVVGVDGSNGAREALRIAVREARMRGASVRAVHVWHMPEGAYLTGIAPAEADTDRYERVARGVLADSVAAVADELGDVQVEQVLRNDPAPAAALIAESQTADLLVVGTRGLGGLRELLLGSVSHACCQHAHCPVLVVPDATRAR